MPLEPANFTINDIKQFIDEDFTPIMAISKKFFDGDHWQDEDGWVGPSPATTDSDRTSVLTEIKRAFVSKNIIKEVVERHRDAVLGREVNWHLKPVDFDDAKDISEIGDEDKAAIAEIENDINNWWQDKEVFKHLTQAIDRLLYSGRGYIRIFIPVGKLENNEIPKMGDLKEALNLIYIEAPDPDQARVLIDSSTMEKIGIHQWVEKINKKEVKFAEITYLEDGHGDIRNTVIKQINDGDEPEATVIGDLGGVTLLYELSIDSIITEQVHENQAAVNMALTMLSRNIVVAGFLERILINAQMPGKTKVVDGVKKFIADKLQVGAGITTSLVGVTTTDDDGGKKLATPSVIYRDPVDVTTFIDSKREGYKNILEETHQGHMILAEAALASGESRIQARADFSVSIYKTKPITDLAVQWLINAILKLTSVVQGGNSEKYIKYRVTSDIKPNSGPLTPEEKNSVIKQAQAGLLAIETAMILLGVNDPVAEMIKIAGQRKVVTPDQLAQLLTALAKVGYKLTIDQMAEFDVDLLHLEKRDVNKFLAELEKIAEIESSKVGSPIGSTNDKDGDPPGPAVGGENDE